jgi:SAM-dependent methyltransferase
MLPDLPKPTDSSAVVASELSRWRRAFAGEHYFYGADPGPIARRAVRYHRPLLPAGGRALDLGCGEGQDLVYLAEEGYSVTGVEFTPEGAEKARRLLAERGLPGEVVQADLRTFEPERRFELVLAVNALQFTGPDAPVCLERAMAMVAPGGVLGLSLFGRERGEAELRGTVYFFTWEGILEQFRGWQCMEGARLWQWSVATNQPQPFVTMIARNAPPKGSKQSPMRLEVAAT